eukprot:CAMPEP_0194271510 /NCGR_PEP_ID=MMETSP0169-20130528/5267_1 /TAXON_ID=218684 /ORGANISM="Corethron pennatum, Strain L29A3" /LENGTH=154 /DNA_ID=CAMNT_0039013869 /DNA_START=65 /DNA_END=529 /DNA_ORIENTATION=-
MISAAPNAGPLAGLSLTAEVYGPVKLWHVLLVAAYVLWGYRNSFFAGGAGGKQVTVSHILVKEQDLELLEDVKVKLHASAELGKTFVSLAKKHSTCPSGRKGGALGTFGPGRMVPAFDRVCWSAPVGEVQGPVQTQFGYHLLLVTDREDGQKQE